MMESGSAVDKHGRMWKAKVMPLADVEEEDFCFWFEDLSPEDRVNSVDSCLMGSWGQVFNLDILFWME